MQASSACSPGRSCGLADRSSAGMPAWLAVGCCRSWMKQASENSLSFNTQRRSSVWSSVERALKGRGQVSVALGAGSRRAAPAPAPPLAPQQKPSPCVRGLMRRPLPSSALGGREFGGSSEHALWVTQTPTHLLCKPRKPPPGAQGGRRYAVAESPASARCCRCPGTVLEVRAPPWNRRGKHC